MQNKTELVSDMNLGTFSLLVLAAVSTAIVCKGGYRIDTAISRAQELLGKVKARGFTGAPEAGWDEKAYQSPNRSEQVSSSNGSDGFGI